MTAVQPTAPLPLVVIPGMLCDESLWSDVGFPEGHLVRHLALGKPDMGELAEEGLALVTGPFVLVGLSLGAIVGFEMLRRAPERVAGVCAMSTNAGAPRAEQYDAWQAMDTLIADGRFAEAVEQTLPAMFHLPDPPGGLAERYRGMAHAVGPHAARAQLAAQATRRDAFGALRTARCPALVLHGERDALCPPDFHQAIARAMTGARARELPGAGHLLPWQRPRDTATAVHEVLAEAERARALGPAQDQPLSAPHP